MAQLAFVVILALISVVISKPVEKPEEIDTGLNNLLGHKVQKRFINPSLTAGDFVVRGFNNMRTKRSEEDECEKLRLCKLHARANRSFFAAFELYFVNRENARLWDHSTHSIAECEQRFSCYDR